MATGTTKRFASVADRHRQLGATLPIAASMPQILVLGDLQVGLWSGGKIL